MAKNFKLLDKPSGYRNKKDVTNLGSNFLIAGSQNVIINDGDKIQIREGYTLDGAANTALTPVQSAYDWNTSTGTELNLRAYDDELEWRYVASDGTVTWTRLASSFTSVAFNFTEWWDSTEAQDVLLFVNGDSNIRMWSGGVTTFASATANTITKQGSTTWAETRFLVGGTRSVIINGTTYAYTGGESTTTLTGVSPDPTSAGHAVASVVFQAIRTTATTPAAAVENDIIGTHDNQVYIADMNRRDVYISKNTSYIDYTFSSPRVPGEGGLLTLDSPPVGFVVQEDNMYISGKKDEWYATDFTLSSDLTKESLTVKRLVTGPGQGAQSQALIGKIKNSVVYISNEPTFDTLGRVENINTPQSKPFSDEVKVDFDGYDFTNGHVKYFRNQTFMALPAEGLVLIYDHEREYWQPPQVLAIRRFAIIGGELYGHSSVVPETYKLFTGTNDNSNPIDAKAIFAYRNYGRRDHQKSFDEWFTEGYISSNTVLQLELKYDFGGATSILEYDIEGDDSTILFAPSTDNSLGKESIGKLPIGSEVATISDLAKFRIIHTMQKIDFYEILVTYKSNDIDFQWEILAQGGNVRMTTSDNNPIKK